MEAEGARYKYLLPERMSLVTNYYKLDADYRAIFEAFTEQFSNAPVPTYCNIHKLHTKFQHMGSVADAPPHSTWQCSCVQKKIRFMLPKRMLKIRDSWQNELLFSWIYRGVRSTALCTRDVKCFDEARFTHSRFERDSAMIRASDQSPPRIGSNRCQVASVNPA